MACSYYQVQINAKQNIIDDNNDEIRKLNTRKGEVSSARYTFNRRGGYINYINGRLGWTGSDLQAGCKGIGCLASPAAEVSGDTEESDGGTLSGVGDGFTTENTRIQNEINRLRQENSRLRGEISSLRWEKFQCEAREAAKALGF